MSKTISEMGPKGSMVDADEFTILDSEDPALATKNKRVAKSVALAGLAPQSAVDAVQSNLDSHEATNAQTAHPDGVSNTDLTNHKNGTNQHPISGVTGLQAALDEKARTSDLGNAAYRDVGTLNTDVAAGDAPANAVSGHTSAIDHTLIPTPAQKAALDANATLSGANAVAGEDDLPTDDQQAAMDAANAPSGGNAFATIADVGSGGTHAGLPDLNTSGHPGGVITIPGGIQGNAVSIAADETLQDAGVPPGGAGGTTDLGHILRTSEIEITSSSGQNTTIAAATAAQIGFATAAQITQLEGTDAAGTARPPTAHAASHGLGQSDELTPAVIGAATAAQGTLADSAVQPGNPLTVLSSGAASDGHVATADGAGGISWQAPSGGGGSGFERRFRFNSTIGGTPTWGEFRLNAAQGSETALLFNQQDQDNRYIDPIVANMQLGDAVTFAGASGEIRDYTVTGVPIDNGTWFQIPVSLDVTELTLVNSTDYLTLFTLLGGAGGIGSDVTLDGYTETGQTISSSAGSLNVPLDGRPRSCTLTENITAWTTPGATLPEVGGCKLSLIQDSTDRTVAYPAAWYWPDGTPVAMPTGSGSVLTLMLDQTMDGRIEARGQVMSQ